MSLIASHPGKPSSRFRVHINIHQYDPRASGQPGKGGTMKRKALIGVAVLAVVAMSASLAMAGPWGGWRGSGGWGMGGGYQRMYNPATVETGTGAIERIDRITPSRGVH